MENTQDQGQAIYDTVVLAAHRNIFGEKDDDTRFKVVLQRLSQGDLAENVGNIAGVTLANIKASAEKQQRAIPQDVIVEASDEVVDQLLDIAEAGKLLNGDRESVKKKAVFAALKVVGENDIKTGKVTPEAKAEAQAAMQKMQGAAPKQPMGNEGVIASRMKQAA